MKRLMIGVLLAVVALGGVAAFLFLPGEDQRASRPEPLESAERAVLSVDDVAARPDEYKQGVAVRGVVSFVSTKEQIAVLISEAEFATCGTACPNVVLPVRWRGELPAITDRVIVRGEIKETERGYLLNAASTEIVEHGKRDDR